MERRSRLFELRQPDRDRTPVLIGVAVVTFAAIVLRLFYLQVIQHPYYIALAEGQRALHEQIRPARGDIVVTDRNSNEEFPLAANRELMFVYANPSLIEDPDEFVEAVAGPLGLDDEARADLTGRLNDSQDQYEPIQRKVSPEVWDELQDLELAGLGAESELWRIYPEGSLAAQVLGYVGFSQDGNDLIGAYGIEGFFNNELAGVVGLRQGERDSRGRRILVGDDQARPATDGADIVLTLDRSIQHMAQQVLQDGVERYQAAYGDIVVMDPTTGAVVAMASAPGFNPNDYEKVKDVSVFKSTAIADTYEPGSTFKALTMAAAVDLDLVTPDTIFTDTGCRKVDVYQICNFDKSGPGQLDARGALERSSNVVMSQIAEKVGRDKLYDYLKAFGLDALTGITLDTEEEVDISRPDSWPDSQLATIGFGQGIATTPLRLISAMSTLANDGRLMEPHIVKEIRYADGSVETFEPKEVGQPLKPSTALTVTAMLVSAIENGVADTAKVDGYTVAGKTGTAQVVGDDGRYDPSTWIASFVGYGPIPDPRFITLIRLYDPATSIHGANTAAPMFAELAPQILHYLRIPEHRDSEGN